MSDMSPSGKRYRSGAPELDALLRKVRKQGGPDAIIGKGAHSIKVRPLNKDGRVDFDSDTIVTLPSSRVQPGTLRGYRQKLRRAGYDL